MNFRRNLPLRLAIPLEAKATPERAAGPVDPVLAAIVIALIGFGVVMVYSASAVQATVQFHDPQYFLKKQAIYAGLGLVVMFVASRIDYHRLYKLTYPLLALVFILLVMTIVGFGHAGGGAARW